MKYGTSGKTPHRWYNPKHAKWLTYCWRCGLLSLKNRATELAVRAGCFPDEKDWT